MPPRARKAAPARSESPPGDHLQLALASQALPPIPAGSAPEPSMRTKPNKETTKNVPPFLTKLYTSVLPRLACLHSRPGELGQRNGLALALSRIRDGLGRLVELSGLALAAWRISAPPGASNVELTALPHSMVSEPETDHLIRWSEDGDSFFGA